MELLIPLVILAMVVISVTFRPTLFGRWTLSPLVAGAVAIVTLFVAERVQWSDIVHSLILHWRPFVMIVATLIFAAIAEQSGVPDQIAQRLFRRKNYSSFKLFGTIFVLSTSIATVLNNDAMIILVTPLIFAVLRRYGLREQHELRPFLYAVFLGIGVAPFYVSNPMNMIAAEYAKVNFNQYASWMIPIALAEMVVTYPIARWVFRHKLKNITLSPTKELEGQPEPPKPGMATSLVIILLTLIGYPIVAYFEGDMIWMVSVSGAILLLLNTARFNPDAIRPALSQNIPWDIFIFLLGVYITAIALNNGGLTHQLAAVYDAINIYWVGIISALGSAMINNHPMSLINLMAIENTVSGGRPEIFATLIGGNVGPRLFPSGSLAGLLWLDACRRQGLQISLKQFMVVGFATTVIPLLVALTVLSLRLL